MNTVNQMLGFEVLTASALHDANWPSEDPNLVEQRTSFWGDGWSSLVAQAAENTHFDLEVFRKKTKGLPTPDRVWWLLTHKAFNFNGVERVREEAYWYNRVAAFVAAGQPIRLAYPLVCKISNPAKRLTKVNVTAGERAIVLFFRYLDSMVREFYAPGIKIAILADSTLYNGALQTPPPTAYAYMDEVNGLIGEMGAEKAVELHDYTRLLVPFHREFEDLYNKYYALLGPNMPDFQVLATGSLPTSMRAMANTRRFGFSYEDLKDLFGPAQTRFPFVRCDIDSLTLHALREQLAIKLACVDLDMPERSWPGMVRATCHKGLKSGRAVLGLRPYPEYYAASRFLPYHGMPVLTQDVKGKPRLTVEPEIGLRGQKSLVRVLDVHGDPVLYSAMA